MILLNEAFNKMASPITATMRYLEDLGLQVVLISPGENLVTRMAYLYRHHDIIRDPIGNAVCLEGHSVSEKARVAYCEDLTKFNPDLIDTELRVIESIKAVASELSVADD